MPRAILSFSLTLSFLGAAGAHTQADPANAARASLAGSAATLNKATSDVQEKQTQEQENLDHMVQEITLDQSF